MLRIVELGRTLKFIYAKNFVYVVISVLWIAQSNSYWKQGLELASSYFLPNSSISLPNILAFTISVIPSFFFSVTPFSLEYSDLLQRHDQLLQVGLAI